MVAWCFYLLVLWMPARAQAIQTHYQLFGEGAPILIINGGPGMNSEGFADMAKEIAKLGYMTIIYDQRGTGQTKLSSINAQTITLDLIAKDIEDLRNELHIKQWTVLGHSFGGMLACHYYALYPKSVYKLIFSSSGGVNLKFIDYLGQRILANLSKVDKDSFLFYQKKLDAVDTSWSTRTARVHFLAQAYVVQKQFASRIAQRLMQSNQRVNQLVIENMIQMKFNYKGRFKHSTLPVLILQGNKDIIRVETAQEIQASFGNSKLVILHNCGHYGWLDAHDNYIQALNDFLKQG